MSNTRKHNLRTRNKSGQFISLTPDRVRSRNGNSTNGHSGEDKQAQHIMIESKSTLSISEVEEMCDTDCPLFISYIYHTNGHSLHNILKLQHNLQLNGINCCVPNCRQTNRGQFYICLHCVFYCCDNGDHLLSHCMEHEHYLYYELSSQSMYCCQCGEYHHSPSTDSMTLKFLEMAQKRKCVRKVEPVEVADITRSLWNHFDCVRDNGLLGIRGALNLGNTCYMNAVLQTFIHNDQLRNYYLSSLHSKQCTVCSHSKQSNDNGNTPLFCISCDLEELFSDFYCGLTDCPLPMERLIGTLWKYPEYRLLSDKLMHDSHEFFLKLLSLLHKTSPDRASDESKCQCIVHSTFRGKWQSEMRCTNAQCQFVSGKLESFLEMNLQFNKSKKEKGGKGLPGVQSSSVEEALRDYMKAESMPDYKCSRCGDTRCLKETTIHSLPQTLCLHLKRFEADEAMMEMSASAKARSTSPNLSNGNGNGNGNGNTGRYQKMKGDVTFPVETALDLSQFVNGKRRGAKVNQKEYWLKSMIIHRGKMSAGHYVCYIRKGDCWYYCDDNQIQSSNTNYVKSHKNSAYMLFYEAR